MSDRLTDKAIETLCNEILKAVEVKTKSICSQMIKKNKSANSSTSNTQGNQQGEQTGQKELVLMTAEEFQTLTPDSAKQLYQSGIRLIVVDE